MLAVELDRISEANWNTRDFTLASLKAAIREVAACFPVYRTYVAERGANVEDRRDMVRAVRRSRASATKVARQQFSISSMMR